MSDHCDINKVGACKGAAQHASHAVPSKMSQAQRSATGHNIPVTYPIMPIFFNCFSSFKAFAKSVGI
jgi:hypothetical protein